MNAAKVRKDLSLLGSFGTRGTGYDAAFLVAQIDRALGVDRDWPVAIVGIGNLGGRWSTPRGSAARGFRVTALFDVDPAVGRPDGSARWRSATSTSSPSIAAETARPSG